MPIKFKNKETKFFNYNIYMIYECVKCGLTSPVKMGKCHKCNQWNCFEEKKESKKNNLKLLVSNKLSDLKTVSNEQI